MKKEVYILVICLAVCACSKREKQEQQTETVAQEERVTDSAVVEDVPLIVVEKVEVPAPVESKPAKEKSVSYSSSYHTSSYSSDEGDYWEEKRKTSPNDNYLLGFDEDVDDVHDMELYMEDY